MIDRTYVPLRAYKPKELAAMYGVSAKTLHKWLEPLHDVIGPLEGQYYKIPQVEIIFRTHGWPLA